MMDKCIRLACLLHNGLNSFTSTITCLLYSRVWPSDITIKHLLRKFHVRMLISKCPIYLESIQSCFNHKVHRISNFQILNVEIRKCNLRVREQYS